MQIWRITVDGDSLQQLTFGAGSKTDPALSPAGNRIAFAWFQGTALGGRLLYTMNLEFSQIVSLTPPTAIAYWSRPSWSPNGATIMATHTASLVGPIFSLNKIPSDGSANPSLFNFGSQGSWSPDGQRVVYVAGGLGSGGLNVVNADGGGGFPLYSDPFSNSDPIWSPNGNWIAWASKRSGNYDLWLISTVDFRTVQLTSSRFDERHPAWSPRGDVIAFDSNHVTGESTLWLLDLTTAIRVQSWSAVREKFR